MSRGEGISVGTPELTGAFPASGRQGTAVGRENQEIDALVLTVERDFLPRAFLKLR
jgi:hypothetical protein